MKPITLKRLKKVVTFITLTIALLLLVLVGFYFWAGSGTLSKEELSVIRNYRLNSQPGSQPGQGITVMTYNLGYLSGMTNNQAMRPPKSLFEKNMKTFLEFLTRTQPDVIAIQEIDYHSKRSYYTHQLDVIAREAGFRYAAQAVNWDNRYVPFPYWPPSVHFGAVLSGQAILSRWPIVSTRRIVLQKPDNPFYYNAFYLDRLVQVAEIKGPDIVLIMLNLHLEAFDQTTREKQAHRVCEIYRSSHETYQKKYPGKFAILLLGDFNALPPDAEQINNFTDEPEADFSTDKTIAIILKETGLKPVVPAAGIGVKHNGFTFPSDKPSRKLDYIFYDPGLITIHDVQILDLDSSDHLPMMIQFSLLTRNENRNVKAGEENEH